MNKEPFIIFAETDQITDEAGMPLYIGDTALEWAQNQIDGQTYIWWPSKKSGREPLKIVNGEITE